MDYNYRKMFILLLILIFIRPFISSLAFEHLNAFYSGILLLFLLIWFIYRRPALPKGSGYINYPLILLSLALAIAVFFSASRINSLKESCKYISGILLFIIASSLSRQQRGRIINAVIFSGVIISLLAVYQYFFGFRQVINYMARENINDAFAVGYLVRKRVYFPFITPNILAGYLAMTIPLALTRNNKNLLIIPLFLALLFTRSIGAFFCLFLGLAVFLHLQGKLKESGPFFLCGLIVFGFIFAMRSLTKIPQLQPIFSSMMRLNYWKETLGVIKMHPLIGAGLGNFDTIYSRYAHNSYLQLWAEAGILGLASFLWLVGAVLKSGLKNIKNSADKIQSAGLIAACVVFLLHNLVDFTFFLPEVSLIWWVIMGSLFGSHGRGDSASA